MMILVGITKECGIFQFLAIKAAKAAKEAAKSAEGSSDEAVPPAASIPVEGEAKPEKPKKVLSPEHLAKRKAGREAKKAAKDAEKAAAEADAIVALGGDGTCRDVATGWPDAPLIAISTGGGMMEVINVDGFSVSMGVASFPHTAASQQELLAACDGALAEARRDLDETTLRAAFDGTLSYYSQDMDIGGRQINSRDAFGTGKYVSALRYEEPNKRKNDLTALELVFDLGFGERGAQDVGQGRSGVDGVDADLARREFKRQRLGEPADAEFGRAISRQ